METEGPLLDCDSDSSEDLPELLADYKFDIAKLLKNDVIWAEFRGLYWPALVRDVDKKNKKIRVWYLDSPGKCFKVPFKKVHDFADSEFCKKVEDEARKHPLGQKHAEVLRKTRQFTFRRFQGWKDNPLEFFDLSKPYFLLKACQNGLNVDEISSVDVSTKNDGDENDNLGEDSEDGISIESDMGNNTSKCLLELYEEDSPYDDEMVDKILSFITSGHVDNYLIDIFNSKINNERHKLYVEAEKKDQIQLFVESQPSIPIKSQKLQHVSIYLHNLYKKNIEKGKPRLNEYIISVWLPEAVDKAVSLIEAKSMKAPDDSSGNDKSSSPSEETSDMTVDSGINKFSSSPDLVTSSELPVDYDKVSSSPTEVKKSESPVDSSCNNELCAPKRRLNLHSSLVENENSDELEIEACSPSEKKFTGRKKRKRSSETLKPRKTSQRRAKLQKKSDL